MQDTDVRTPWQRVFHKFSMSQSDFAVLLGRHRSKVSRALRDKDGFISGKDQKILIEAARERGIVLLPDDLACGTGQ